MAFNLKNRSFLKEIDFEPRELRYLLRLSEALKLAKYAGTEAQHLVGKEIALIFEKTSTRTRSAFEVGAYDQGAHVTYLDPSGSQLGHKESVADTAAVLGRMYDAIEFRGRRRTRRPRRRAGVQRAHRRVAPHPDARRLSHHARGQQQAL
jgi:ornithine carbamoyltransferase